MIDTIWNTYDEDMSGELDKEETRNFIQQLLGSEKMTDANFNNVFAAIDEDGSGLIDKAELAMFVRKLSRDRTTVRRPQTNER